MRQRLIFLPAFIVILTFLIVGTFCDLTVSNAIVNTNSFAGHLFAGITGVPVCLFFAFTGGSSIKLAAIRYKKVWQRILLITFAISIIFIASFVCGEQFVSYHAFNLGIKWAIPVGLCVAIPGALLGFFLFKFVDNPHVLRLFLFMVICIGVTAGLVEVIKLCAPRVRYTSILKTSVDNFRPWYLPNISKEVIEQVKEFGIEEAKSFPSGHSNFAFGLAFVLSYLPLFIPKLIRKQWLLFYIGFAYYLLIAFMRMRTGAHYLSDVAFGALISIAVYFIANEIYIRKLDTWEYHHA